MRERRPSGMYVLTCQRCGAVAQALYACDRLTAVERIRYQRRIWICEDCTRKDSQTWR